MSYSSVMMHPSIHDRGNSLLPPSGHNRWIPRHKEQVVHALSKGQISIRDVEERYTLSVEELVGWWKEYTHPASAAR
jgi:hypothetical protein